MSDDGKLDPYYYCREQDGSGWSVRGPNGFCVKKVQGAMDKNVAYIIAKLLSDQPADALSLLCNVIRFLPGGNVELGR
jgi:hypothetical protein